MMKVLVSELFSFDKMFVTQCKINKEFFKGMSGTKILARSNKIKIFLMKLEQMIFGRILTRRLDNIEFLNKL